jgi:hypothetical protein
VVVVVWGVAHPFACVVVAWPSKLRFKTKKNNSADFFGGIGSRLFVRSFEYLRIRSTNNARVVVALLCQHDSFKYYRPPLSV